MRRAITTVGAVLAASGALSGAAYAAFPYVPAGADPRDYTQYRLPAGANRAPADLRGNVEWMYAATPEPGNFPVNGDPSELNGVRGASLVDDADVDTAWRTTTGRPDVTIAVLDSGIEWNDRGAMENLRRKTRLSRGELPPPRHDRATALEAGEDCARFRDAYDANDDGVFNVVDYACDARVERDPAARGGLGVGPADLLDPQDVLIAFSNGDDADGNGFVDDIVGWDFLDDDNDPYDDVQYGHGTGEAQDSTAEADNGGALGACPNCMAIHLRVGDSFIADVNRFAQAAVYATDNDALVIQEALGTLNNTRLARDAVEYAYRHGVTVIASAADEAAQHDNWPSSYPHVIVVNSVTRYDETFTPVPRSYLQFNGCTNFSAKITVAIPSVSCSSDATGRGSGMAGLIYSAALNAHARGDLPAHPDCRRADGGACVITPNEVRQVMASGRVGGAPQADDVNFAAQPEPSCSPLPRPGCTDPLLGAPGNWAVVSPLVETRRYPARKGHDQFYGWGRVNMNRAVDAVDAGNLPPEVEITSPDWFDFVDPRQDSAEVRGEVFARGEAYRCRVYVAPGSYPNDASTEATPPGDFQPVPSAWCDGSERSTAFAGTLARLDVQALRRRFPATAGAFDGRETGIGAQTQAGRPNSDPYGFTVKVVATVGGGASALAGEDRRNLRLHHDRDLLAGFPKRLPGDGESSPLLVDLDGDNENELVLGTSDGLVHAWRRDGSELRGWPARGDLLALHRGGRAFRSGALGDEVRGAILGAVAAADLDRDGTPEVVAANLEGRVYVWNARGERERTLRANPDWSGRPLRPFVDERRGPRNRTQHGFLGAPVLADVDGDDGGRLEIVAAGMDRHLYAWNDDGTAVPGFPVLVVDQSKVASVDPASHAVRFNDAAGSELNQGAIVDTPAVGDLTGDGRPEIVVGTNEEYAVGAPGEGGLNAGNLNTASLALIGRAGVLDFANGRLYAIEPTGDPDGPGAGASAFLDGWPVKVARIFAELLPVVGEGITGAPVIGEVRCPNGGEGAKVGAIPDAGVAYVLNPDGTSCYGKDPSNGRDIGLQSDTPGNPARADAVTLPAVGHPAFGNLGGGTAFLAPTTGVLRALDLAANEYQGGEDSVSAWDASTGQFRPGFPARVNDLQFLTGPSVADIDGVPGEEVLAGTASLDLQAFDAAGAPASAAWPKLTSDWMVANPLIGPFGGGARKTVIALTRSGQVLAYDTQAPACSPGSWPRFHHDNANSGDTRRDAVAPGVPEDVRVQGGRLVWRAPGDDLRCGRAARYEVVTSNGAIRGESFASRRPVAGAPEPAEPGTEQSLRLPAAVLRRVAIRAVDEQGNVGRPAVVPAG